MHNPFNKNAATATTIFVFWIMCLHWSLIKSTSPEHNVNSMLPAKNSNAYWPPIPKPAPPKTLTKPPGKKRKQGEESYLTLIKKIGGLESRISYTENNLTSCQDRLGDPLTDEETELASRRFRTTDKAITVDNLDDLQRTAVEKIDNRIEKRTEDIRVLEKRLVSHMEKGPCPQ